MSMVNELNRADSMIQNGMYGEAIELLNRILHEEPDNIEAIRSIGIAYTEYNEPMRARKALDYFFLFRQDDPQAFEAYGCACFKMGEYETSGSYLEKAEKLMSDSASIKRNLGVAYNQTGRKE